MKRPLFLLFCLLCLGIWLWYPRSYGEDPCFPQGSSYSVQVTGTVSSYEKKENSFSLTLTGCQIIYENQRYECDRLLVSISSDPQVRAGNTVSLTGSLSAFQPARNPGNTDWRLYYLARHMSYRVYADGLWITDPQVSWLKDGLLTLRDHWQAQLDQMEHAWHQMTVSPFSSVDLSAMLSALLLGNSSGLSETVYGLYETAGILPLLSISGLHLSLIGGTALAACRKLRLPLWLRSLLASLLMLLYWQLCGGKVSAGRAAILFFCLNLAPVLRRSWDPLSALSLAGILFLLGSPLLLFQSSFLLSFAAMLGIYLVQPALRFPQPVSVPTHTSATGIGARFFPGSAVGRYLANTLSFAFSVQLAVFPLTISLFYRYPAYSIPVNLLILPLTTPMLLSGILGLLVSEISLSAGLWLTLPCRGILWLYEQLCQLISHLPAASLLLGKPAASRAAVYYALLTAFVLIRTCIRRQEAAPAPGRSHSSDRDTSRRRCPPSPHCPVQSLSPGRGMRPASPLPYGVPPLSAPGVFPLVLPGRHRRISLPSGSSGHIRLLKGISLLLLLSLLPSLLLPLPRRELQVTFVDVGQGDCALIRSPSGTAILIDGGSSDLARVTEDRLIPFLESQGIGRLDYVFLSHTDEDHVNAVVDWLEAGYVIGTMILPQLNEALSSQHSYQAIRETAQHYQIPLLFFCSGDLWQEEELSLLCLGPQAPDSPSGSAYTSLNAASLVLMLEYEGFRILFTGDCCSEGETMLVRELADRGLTCNVLKAGHHGSRTSTGDLLLRQLQPSLCLISCGVQNSYHHPHPEMTARLNSAGIPYYITADRGAILLRIRSGHASLRTILTP